MKKTKWFKPIFELPIDKTNDHTFAVPAVPVTNARNKQTEKKKLAANFKKNSNLNILDKVAPQSVSDLAIHNKKIIEVETWLNNYVLSPHKISALLITGPTGAGKTATVHVMCKELNINIAEWINPVEIEMEEFRGPGQTARFTEFMIQSSRYPSLVGIQKKKVILVEDFPNSIVHNPSEFETILEMLYHKGKSSVIFICTDTKDNNLNLSHQLFPDPFKIKYKIQTISFNPISVTLLRTAMKRACTILDSNYRALYQVPNQDTIESIVNTAMGDVRCAMNYLNFACLKGFADLPTTVQISQKTGTKRKRKDKDKGTLTHMARDESLGLLHGVGRVLYPKRCQKPGEKHWTFEHKPEDIVNQFLSIPTLFVSFLHENYLRYYGADDFNDVRAAAELLSDAELLMSQWLEREMIVQYGLWIAIMGLMVNNRHAVAKWNPVQGPKHLKYKITQQSYENLIVNPIDVGYHNIIKPPGYISNTAGRFTRM